MKRTALLALCAFCISAFSSAQTSTETFETESHGSTSFTDNGVTFKIISHIRTFKIQGNQPNTGWNGTAVDNRYIDNTQDALSTGGSFSIKTTSNLFKVTRFWVYVANSLFNQQTTGTLTITGKLSGVTRFTRTKVTGFVTSVATNNGYTPIDMANLDGQDYTNIVIDELQLTLGGNYAYLGLDAFTWVKDANIVLPVNFGTVGAIVKNNNLNVHWETQTETNNDHFNIEASKDGNTFTSIATVASKAIGGNSNTVVSYEWASNSSVTLTASLMAFALVFLTSFRRKKILLPSLAAVIAVSVTVIGCSKGTDEIATSGHYYIRIAQVDKDGTTTYSKVVKVVKD
ncbi:hypothetical protein [Niabella sp.]|uniref:hypothetical protein n=1 Tax=Niabella sp. TaxID=1962976 RepID=UPI0026075A0B|nr:hypothetical protein [Niabella sp.]